LRNVPQHKEFEVNGRFVLNRTRGKVMGVAAGLADWTGIDALLIRLGMVAALLLTGPVVILFYVLTGWLASDH
jgi:phage shock protein C